MFVLSLGNSLGGYRKNEMEEDYIAPMVEKKKKEKNGKPQGVANGTAKKVWHTLLTMPRKVTVLCQVL